MPIAIHSGGGGSAQGDKAIKMYWKGNEGWFGGFLTTTDGEAPPTYPQINANVLSTRTWFHIVFLKEGNLLKIYLNGNLINSVNDSHAQFSLISGILDIGAPNYYNGGWIDDGRDTAKWKGKIDDVRVYNRSLSSAEVQTLFNTPSPADVSAPVISAVIASNITTSTALITWTTNENSTSILEFGPTTAYGQIASETGSVTNHSVSLNGLASNATYHFRVVSADAVGNQSVSGDATFSTISLADGLIAYYPFDGSVNDASGNGKNATNFGSTFVSGKVGQCLSFNGVDNYVSCGDFPEFAFGNSDFTVALWFKPSSYDHEFMLAEKFDGMTGPGWTFYAAENSEMGMYFYSDVQAVTLGNINTVPQDFNWHHAIMRRQADFWQIYMDGIEVASKTVLYSMTNSGGPLEIGRRDSYWYYYPGLIDEVRFYNRAITSSEIQALSH